MSSSIVMIKDSSDPHKLTYHEVHIMAHSYVYLVFLEFLRCLFKYDFVNIYLLTIIYVLLFNHSVDHMYYYNVHKRDDH